jgi:magnesium chelatase family protein
MTPAEVGDFCKAEEQAQSLLKAAMKQLHLSARAFHRILKLGRTIADLDNGDIDNGDMIRAHHLAEAIQYRPRRMV